MGVGGQDSFGVGEEGGTIRSAVVGEARNRRPGDLVFRVDYIVSVLYHGKE